TTALCVAVGSGPTGVFTSTDPTAGAGAWSHTQLHHSAGHNGYLESVSCASPSLCVIGAGAGQVVTSSDPTGGAEAWRRVDAADRWRRVVESDGRRAGREPVRRLVPVRIAVRGSGRPGLRGYVDQPGGARPRSSPAGRTRQGPPVGLRVPRRRHLQHKRRRS